MKPEFFFATQAAAHAHGASVVHSLPFGIGVAIVGGYILSLLFGGRSRSQS